MTKSVNSIDKYLPLGIDAARAGRRLEARQYLRLALKQSPDHIPTLLWLAFVAPSVQESLEILEHVLTLDPDNDRAKSGVAWARQQLADATPTGPEIEIATSQPGNRESAAVQETAGKERVGRGVVGRARHVSRHGDDFPIVTENIRAGKEKRRRVQPAQRRSLKPWLAVSIFLGAAAMIVAGIWLWAFIPPDTLAAWLPAAKKIESNEQLEATSLPIESETNSQPETVETSAGANALSEGITGLQPHVAQKADVVMADQGGGASEFNPGPVFGDNSAVQTLTVPSLEFSSGTAASVLSIETVNEVAAAPFELFGPVGEAVIGHKLNEPVDESNLAHIPAHPDEKWIEVDVTRQIVTAWEGNVPILSFLASTGLPNTPTVLGNFNIYWKLESTLMTGPGYYLPDVPYTMYFYGGYGLHGTYWHDNFGEPMSHGCVNLRNDNAKQLFEWADPVIPPGQTQVTSSATNPGTLVVVHE